MMSLQFFYYSYCYRSHAVGSIVSFIKLIYKSREHISLFSSTENNRSSFKSINLPFEQPTISSGFSRALMVVSSFSFVHLDVRFSLFSYYFYFPLFFFQTQQNIIGFEVVSSNTLLLVSFVDSIDPANYRF